MNSAAPISAPYMRPVPPSTSMISSSAERGKPSTSKPTNCVVCASNPPAMPATPAAMVNIRTWRLSTGAPMAGMRLLPSRKPRRLRPKGELTSRRISMNSKNSTAMLYT